MEHITTPPAADFLDPASSGSAGLVDDWQRRFGVPWDRVDRAARAVLERAAAASRRRFADLSPSSGLSTEARVG